VYCGRAWTNASSFLSDLMLLVFVSRRVSLYTVLLNEYTTRALSQSDDFLDVIMMIGQQKHTGKHIPKYIEMVESNEISNKKLGKDSAERVKQEVFLYDGSLSSKIHGWDLLPYLDIYARLKDLEKKRSERRWWGTLNVPLANPLDEKRNLVRHQEDTKRRMQSKGNEKDEKQLICTYCHRQGHTAAGDCFIRRQHQDKLYARRRQRERERDLGERLMDRQTETK